MIAAPAILWWFRGEAFLSLTERQPAEALIVEGWIGVEGFRAAKAEFDRGGYQYIVTTGSLTGKSWTERRWSLVEIAKAELLRIGVPPDKIIAAPAPATESQRTYEAAVMAWRALQAQPFQVKAVNVFTLGARARRSRQWQRWRGRVVPGHPDPAERSGSGGCSGLWMSDSKCL